MFDVVFLWKHCAIAPWKGKGAERVHRVLKKAVFFIIFTNTGPKGVELNPDENWRATLVEKGWAFQSFEEYFPPSYKGAVYFPWCSQRRNLSEFVAGQRWMRFEKLGRKILWTILFLATDGNEKCFLPRIISQWCSTGYLDARPTMKADYTDICHRFSRNKLLSTSVCLYN